VGTDGVNHSEVQKRGGGLKPGEADRLRCLAEAGDGRSHQHRERLGQVTRSACTFRLD